MIIIIIIIITIIIIIIIISALLLEDTDLFITYHDKLNIAIWRPKQIHGRLVLTGKRWVVRYTIPFFHSGSIIRNFQDYFHVI